MTRPPGFGSLSLLRAGVAARVGAALIASGLVWTAILWAMA